MKLGLFKLQLTLKKHYLHCWIQVTRFNEMKLVNYIFISTAVIDRVTLETVSFTGENFVCGVRLYEHLS